jgi:hypothetical protein
LKNEKWISCVDERKSCEIYRLHHIPVLTLPLLGTDSNSNDENESLSSRLRVLSRSENPLKDLPIEVVILMVCVDSDSNLFCAVAL